MSKVTVVKEAVKETLVGSTEPQELSAQTKARFIKHAIKEDGAEPYLGPDEFINAVAPPSEDYVSPFCTGWRIVQSSTFSDV